MNSPTALDPAPPEPTDNDAEADKATRLFAQAQARVQAQDASGARGFLQAAAQAGHLPALLQLAAWDLIGLGGPVDPASALARAQQAAERGHAPALTLQAQLIAAGADGQPRDFDAALQALLAAARAGEPHATVQLALLIPHHPAHGAAREVLLRSAALAGEPVARMFVQRMPPAPPGPMPQWDELPARVAWPHLRPLPPARLRSADPRIVALPGLLTADECIYLALKGLPLLRPAAVIHPDGRSVLDPIRSNETAKFGLLEADALVQSLDLRVAAALGHPAENGEGLALLRYQVGQQYLPHCDWIDPARAATQAELARWGQRIATCVVYLNDGFEGGATAFPELAIEFRGSVGDAFVWDNVHPDGTIDPRTLHAGCPPTQGMKYLLSKWMRDRSQAGHDV